MNDNNRRFFSPEQKVSILREHLVEGKAVSDLCEKHRIHPTVQMAALKITVPAPPSPLAYH